MIFNWSCKLTHLQFFQTLITDEKDGGKNWRKNLIRYFSLQSYEGLQSLLFQLHACGRKWQLTVNHKKNKTMIFNTAEKNLKGFMLSTIHLNYSRNTSVANFRVISRTTKIWHMRRSEIKRYRMRARGTQAWTPLSISTFLKYTQVFSNTYLSSPKNEMTITLNSP